MSESASTWRRRAIADRISASARELAEAHGLDGFTMDDLAARAGVSRRTLFNYVDGKFDAVLGARGPADDTILDTFRAGGPHGHVGADIKAVVGAFLDTTLLPAEEWDRVRVLVSSDPRLHRELHNKFSRISDFFTEAILEREGDSITALHARALSAVTLSLFDVALDAYISDPSRSLAQHYLDAFEGAIAHLA